MEKNIILNCIKDMDKVLSRQEFVDEVYKNIKLSSLLDEDVVIKGNTEGILYLIFFLFEMLKKEDSDHFHFDQYNGMEQGSVGLIFEKDNNL